MRSLPHAPGASLVLELGFEGGKAGIKQSLSYNNLR